VLAIDQSEGEAELCFKLVLPLTNHSSRGGDQNEIEALLALRLVRWA
jgi:hypothetical protein